MPRQGLRIGVAFGGRSVEHDVSIITGIQAVEALSERHVPVPIYLTRSGAWRTGDALRDVSAYAGAEPGEPVTFDLHDGCLLSAADEGSLLRRGKRQQRIELDAVLLATHGTEGEDGCLEGVMELAGIPYVGPPVGAAAAAMDKAMSKTVLAAAGLPALDWVALRREVFERDPVAAQETLLARLPLPVYVKPANLGSSVGVSRCADATELRDALELGFELDRVCLVEPAVEGGIEVNCAVIGRPGVEPRASVCEQPIAGERFLSFEDKYMGGGKDAPGAGVDAGTKRGAGRGEAGAGQGEAGADAVDGAKGAGLQAARRIIPAPLPEQTTRHVQELACRAFTAFGCAGVTRVDFLIDAHGRVFVNECNTIPGSFSFYLWEPAGLPFVQLLDELLDIALAEGAEKARTTRVFESNLLAARSGRGKG
ncbi:MAG: D-alanine--D-alanine ligase [Solirubrobacteraceae bacterium]